MQQPQTKYEEVSNNLKNRGMSLADLVEWKIQAERKRKRLKEDMIQQRLQDDSPSYYDSIKEKPNLYIKTSFSTSNLLNNH